ncbi:unnamed protein product, partial [Thelazia callipaeda]|uniref:poly(ADP-ribose) glycohydrolase n=1 Tax=Thelazia callipaeda TaxID=103827 RepID=A0A0N5CY18_THECL
HENTAVKQTNDLRFRTVGQKVFRAYKAEDEDDKPDKIASSVFITVSLFKLKTLWGPSCNQESEAVTTARINKLKELHASDIESLRRYDDMYPDLNHKSTSDVLLICISSSPNGIVHEPYPLMCTDMTYGWNCEERYVRLPYSVCNIVDGIPRYRIMKNAISKLLEPLKSYEEIEVCIKSYSNIKCFDALKYFFDIFLDAGVRAKYLSSVVPFIAKLALQSPLLITQPLPLLRRGQSCSVTMSQHQAASLLAHAFFCTYPSRNNLNNRFSLINFNRLFSMRTANVVEKLRCLLHYFDVISEKMPEGLLSFRRQNDSVQCVWSSLQLPLSPLYVSSVGSIEDSGYGMLEVDFANKYIGGGVLSSGCVQEEIRFLIYPELIISMLLCEKLDNNEAVVICGAERFSNYVGYGSSFRWCPMEIKNPLPRDRFRRLCCELVAMDALPFYNKQKQFNIDAVNRELFKVAAYVGFAVKDDTFKPVATGKWGCGAFGGDLDLKSMIQLMASSARKRPLCYFTFGDSKFAEDFRKVYRALVNAEISVGELYDMIGEYCFKHDKHNSLRLFKFILSKLENTTHYGKYQSRQKMVS